MGISFVIWLIPFLMRIIIGDGLITDNQIDVAENALSSTTINRLIDFISAGNNFESFKLIFLNNTKCFSQF
jgi:Ran GTPase-activating protein (RanGAP) involved in mRNA processing and transport